MRIGFYDVESQGLAPTDRITEVGLAIYNVRTPELYALDNEFSALVHDEQYPPQTQEIIELTGITDELLQKEGRPPILVFSEVSAMMSDLDYIVAHNASFDKGITLDKFKLLGLPEPKAKWICSLNDVPWAAKYKCKKLAHLAYDHSILVDPATLHRALDDVKLLARLILEKYDFNVILEYASSPWVYLRATEVLGPWKDGGVSNAWAKANGYGWEGIKGTEEKFAQCWVKRVKKFELEENLKQPYGIIVLKESL